MSVASEIPHILVVDDDARIRQMLEHYLSDEGLRVTTADGGAAMRVALHKDNPDIILLDLILPGDDGLALAQEIRQRLPEAGIIMLTGRNDPVDLVVGLEVGADDCIAKPFHLREVLARIRSLLRRVHSAKGEKAGNQVLSFEGWSLDPGRRRLTGADGREVALTSGEFDLLHAFAKHPQRVLKREQLMDMTKGREWDPLGRSIDAQIVRLRKKVEADPKKPALIKSVRSVGYVFAATVRAGGNSYHD
ncbi:response regulator [Microvirga terricola]|uniref:Response regulator n=1 Tax=Microvirga terricola TaxID=2719797 RepID=A0ABX0V772_9HYPH|nr:response regulator [Microvirga terricola]NIX75049.1 response regulator [Microvirga terricola]